MLQWVANTNGNVENVEFDLLATGNMVTEQERKRALLLMSPATYRAGAFLSAAQKLDLDAIVGVDLPELLAEYWHVPLGLDFANVQNAVQTIVGYAQEYPLAAILSIDDSASELAAR